jgi:hypothetical protein
MQGHWIRTAAEQFDIHSEQRGSVNGQRTGQRGE